MANKKIIIIIIVALVLLAAAALGYYYNLAGRAVSFWQKDSGGSEACDKLAGRAAALCLKQSALSVANEPICRKIDDAGIRADCLEKVGLRTAVAEKDLSACQAIENLMTAKTCLKSVINEDFENADCDSLTQKDYQLFCLSEKNALLARKTGDAGRCNQIPDTISRANCLSEIKKIDLYSDADKDEVNFLAEIIAGTNPDKADTDGDGQPDGVEIANGYNPDGSGKLGQVLPDKLIKCTDIKEESLRAICRSEYNGGQINIVTCEGIHNQLLLNYCLEKQKALK